MSKIIINDREVRIGDKVRVMGLFGTEEVGIVDRISDNFIIIKSKIFSREEIMDFEE